MNAHFWGTMGGAFYRPVDGLMRDEVSYLGSTRYGIQLGCQDIVHGFGRQWTRFPLSGYDEYDNVLPGAPVDLIAGPHVVRVTLRFFMNEVPMTPELAALSGWDIGGANCECVRIWDDRLQIIMKDVGFDEIISAHPPDEIPWFFYLTMAGQTLPFLSDRGFPGGLPDGPILLEFSE